MEKCVFAHHKCSAKYVRRNQKKNHSFSGTAPDSGSFPILPNCDLTRVKQPDFTMSKTEKYAEEEAKLRRESRSPSPATYMPTKKILRKTRSIASTKIGSNQISRNQSPSQTIRPLLVDFPSG
jgi:hypothetical protein